ncbi:ABC transporter substrate-binding protein [Vibrio sonorensis]|uniref:ABC transporter substrate-binding protein n=1 Tax=Vibrio sonorensis TaxID=1004316 RepID=UPI0008DB1F42|nr:ABC transporter substrate-binding protein [Vibrio sonorensis]
MKIPRALLNTSILLTPLLSLCTFAQDRLTVYCSATNALCESTTRTFAQKYQVDVSFIRLSTGSTLAKIDAEKKNPRADIWYGGTFDPHSQAGEMGLLMSYRSPELVHIQEKFKDPARRKGHYSSAIYIGILGFGINKQRLEEKQLDTPLCWKDLTKPALRDEIQIADTQSSGTAYTALTTFIQLWGEEQAFEYLKELDRNISQYTKSGFTPSRNLARGDITVGIGFLHDYVLEQSKGAQLELVLPCEGTGYEIGGVSIIKGARNIENAKKFVDYVLSKQGQENIWKLGNTFQTLTNVNAQQSPKAYDPEKINLVDYDMQIFGSTKERKRLITKWVNTIKMSQAQR